MENWTWGLSLIALTMIIHSAGVVFIALALHKIWVRVENQSIALRHVFVILISLIGTVGLLLGVLHAVEAGFWARLRQLMGCCFSASARPSFSR